MRRPIGLSAAIGVKTQEITDILKHDVISRMFMSGCEQLIMYVILFTYKMVKFGVRFSTDSCG